MGGRVEEVQEHARRWRQERIGRANPQRADRQRQRPKTPWSLGCPRPPDNDARGGALQAGMTAGSHMTIGGLRNRAETGRFSLEADVFARGAQPRAAPFDMAMGVLLSEAAVGPQRW